MKNNKVLLLILINFFIMSCSPSVKKTSAKLKLNLSGITNFNSNIGSGGVLLFGKSSTGEQFGKLVNGPELDMDLANGDWSFYAVMWENNFASNFSDTVYCGKSVQVLNGAAISIGLSLTNAQCAGADFSSGNHYVSGSSKIRFPDLYIEECDELDQSNGFTCKRDNQGSALSYRMAFKSYTKAPNGLPVFSSEVLYSQCMAAEGASSVMQNGMKVNFPTAIQAMPFIISTEMFLGSTDCSNNSGKGVYTHIFTKGVAAQSSLINKVVIPAAQVCSAGPANKYDCENFLGQWDAGNSTCAMATPMTAAFLPAAHCSGTMATFTTRYLKQMVTIPKDFLCRNVNAGLFGANVFPGGQGTNLRPFKICDEWQLNQIGEQHTTSSLLSTKSYKLMNDLDMNKADFNPLLRPTCIDSNDIDNIYKRHHNLNPLDQKTIGGCTAAYAQVPNGYTGVFNGNNKTISHARIYIDDENVGFVGKLGVGGVIKNLNFENLEVEGNSYVGGVAGVVTGSAALISNVTIRGGNIDADNNVAGGIAGEVENSAGLPHLISGVRVENMDIYAKAKIGGLVATNSGIIEKSMFRGKIHHHTSADDNVGGLVGEAKASSIVQPSSSEGQIESYAKWTGGIAGINAGIISNVYSSMYILSKYNGTGAHVGGIAAGNESGTISRVYSNGALAYEGGQASGYIIDAIKGAGGSVLNCVIPNNLGSASSCEVVASLTTGTTGLSTLTPINDWTANVVGALPRLKWESEKNSRPCLLSENILPLASQAGRGTATNPFVICSSDQLKSLSGTAAYAVLAEDIKISHWTSSDLITSFNGVLNGLGHSIYGLNLFKTGYTGHLGIVINNTGKIYNLNIVGNKIINYNGSHITGVLAGVNSGSLEKISMFHNTAEGVNYVGIVAGENLGLINDVYVNEGSLSGSSFIGGVTGYNSGTISRASVNNKIFNVLARNNYFQFAGIAGHNAPSGVVDQVVYAGQMLFSSDSSEGMPAIGGIIGYNEGALSNAMTKKYSTLSVKNATGIGGLIGFNGMGASLKKSISVGKVLYMNGVVPVGSSFSQTVGSNAGFVEAISTFLLENNSAGYLGSATTTSCTGNFTIVGTNPSYLTTAAIATGTQANLILYNYSSANYAENLGLTPFTFASDYIISAGTCSVGESYSFYRGYEPSSSAKITANELNEVGTYVDFNMGYESGAPYGLKVEELIAFYKARMYKTSMPTGMVAPVWVFDDHEGPRLLQVND